MSNNPSSRFLSTVTLFAVVLAATSIWLYAHRDLPWAFHSGDEAEYAEMGRRLASGRGFTTGIIFPCEVDWGVDDQHPALLRPPLWPVVLAAAFTVAGPQAAAAHIAVLVCFVATSVLAFALAAVLGGIVAL